MAGVVCLLGCLSAATSAQCTRSLRDFRGVIADTGWIAHELKHLSLHRNSVAARDDVSHGIDLRILPLGASITAGEGSSDGNGYRQYLQQALAGSKVRFVGSLRSGSMADNYHEGHSGFTITLVKIPLLLPKILLFRMHPTDPDANRQVEAAAAAAVGFRPNVILLYVGTNDLENGSSDPDGEVPDLRFRTRVLMLD